MPSTPPEDLIIEIDEIECNIDEDIDDEHYTGKKIHDSFINKLKDFSSFNPSGNKGKEKGNNSVIIVPRFSLGGALNS